MKTRFLFNSLNNLRGLTLISTLLLGMEAKAQSCLLHYDKPATFFEEALPIGNDTDLLAGYSRTLDISKAIATVQTASQMREYFASAPDSVIVIHLQALGGSKLNQRFGYHCQLANLQRATVSNTTATEASTSAPLSVC